MEGSCKKENNKDKSDVAEKFLRDLEQEREKKNLIKKMREWKEVRKQKRKFT